MKTLKVLCISDKVDPLIYSSNVKKRFGNINLILSAGDLNMDYYGFIVSSLNKPLLFVFGNHNLKKLHKYRKTSSDSFPLKTEQIINFQKTYGATYVGDKVLKVNSLLIAGLGGSRIYNGGANQFSEIDMGFKIMKLLPFLIFNRLIYGRWLDILLTHAPPWGIGDKNDKCHQGFKVFRIFMKIFKPKYLLHGHIHLYDINAQREFQFKKTKIVNIYEHKILEIEIL